MEVLLDCFFENFAQLERNTLHARYKRRDLVEYFNTLIEGCCRGENSDAEKVVRSAIISILRYHENSKKANGSICRMGNYHNILYIGVRICYDWQLKDSPTVAALLDHIYCCENTFERMWIGALFGTSAPYYIAGWKSDFNDQEENLRAVVYYLEHARNANLEYVYNSNKVRFIDVPIESCGKATPLNILVQLGVSDKLHILLRYGAQDDNNKSVLDNLLNNLNSYNRKYPYNLIDCLQFLMRALPGIYIAKEEKSDLHSNYQRDIIAEQYPYLIEDGIVPISRCGIQPPELKHLCRCCIRHSLWQNYMLPNGIRMLPVPDFLHRYLDLLHD
ncbi:hypothetical protein FQA39_LY04423 [Lamprigera yunnana]|nr:hypothetical protein FQA39_LY04423 [Lamprigera yunnana]